MTNNTSWTGELSTSSAPIMRRSTSSRRSINFAVASDVLINRARQALPPIFVSVLARYTGFQGVDESEYSILVTALISLADSSPTKDQLLESRAQPLSQGFKGDLGENTTIWLMSAIHNWYEYAVLKTTPRAPDRLFLGEDWGQAEATKATEADARALVAKMKGYMESGANILEYAFSREGLSVAKLEGGRGEEEQTHEKTVQTVDKGKGRQISHNIEDSANTEPHQDSYGIDLLLLAASVLEQRESQTQIALSSAAETPQQNGHTARQDSMIAAPQQNDVDNHDPEKPYVCGICGKNYTSKPIMRRHLRLNHGVMLGAR